MSCLKCRLYCWPDPQPPLPGSDCCLFHAPADQKGVEARDFNVAVYTRIDGFKRSSGPGEVCHLSGTIFPADIEFDIYTKDNPLPPVTFEGAQFTGKTAFRRTRFSGPAIFRRAHFEAVANFFRASFAAKADFTKATFEGHTYFNRADFHKSAIYYHTVFENNLSFIRTLFRREAVFYRTIHEGVTFFYKTTHGGKFIFRNPISNDKVILQDIPRLDDPCLLNTDLASFKFLNVKWPREKERFRIPSEDDPSKLHAVTEFYRQMKKHWRDRQNDNEASQWHYAEKEAFRKSLRLGGGNAFQRFYLGLYGAISRYGESPGRALSVLGMLMLTLLAVLSAGALAARDGGQPPLEGAAFAQLYFQFILLDKPAYPLPPLFASLALFITRLLIPVQAAIFAFALRNKLHR